VPERRASRRSTGAAGHRAGAEALKRLIRPSGKFRRHPSASGRKIFLMNKPARRERFVEPIQQIYPTGKSLLVIRKNCQAPESKIFLFFRNKNRTI
jgi:hypothetical protein